jgi:alpha-mannosidase
MRITLFNRFALLILSCLVFAVYFAAKSVPAEGKIIVKNKNGEPDSRNLHNTKLEEIIIVYKSHFDIGYTHLASEVVRGYQTTTIDKALDVADKNRNLPSEQQFVWTIPGWPMKKILEDWDGQTVERQNRIRQAFKDGRFAAHALPFTIQTELLEPEALVRSLGFASKLARDAGNPLPTGAKMTDVPSHSKILPTLLKNAGVNFLHLGCNSASTAPRVPDMFWWEGPDGSKLLTMYSGGYGTGILPPENWNHKVWLAMLMRGDNQGPPEPADVIDAINQIKKALPNVKVRIGTLGDFGESILKEDLSMIPVIREDMPDTWIHGPMCDPEGVKISMETVPKIYSAAVLGELFKNWNINNENQEKAIADSYENNILYFEHTWGGAMYWIAKYLPAKDGIGQVDNWDYGDKWKADLKTNRFDRLTTSWEEHTDYARNSGKSIVPILNENMETLARSIDVNGPRTVIFNPLPWKRNAVVNGTLIKDIPAGGYKTIPYSEDKIIAQGKSNLLENSIFKIVVDSTRGTIRSIVDKRSGKELVDGSSSHGFGQFLHERFSSNEISAYTKAYVKIKDAWGFIELGKPNLPSATDEPYQAITPEAFNMKTTLNGNTSVLEMSSTPKKGRLDYPVTTRISLHGEEPYIDIEITIDKPADPWPEAGWICLPFNINAPQFRVGRNGFIMDPVSDIVAGANRYMYAVGTGVAVFNSQGSGIGVSSPDAPLVSLGEPGCWKFDFDYAPTKPVVYFNLFNNQWSTNYRFWNEGKWSYRFRIWSYEKYDAAQNLITPSYETKYPVEIVTADAPAGMLPKEQTGVSLSRQGVMITAYGQNPDGEGTILRLWEQAGNSGDLTVTFPAGSKYKTATPVNLRGEKISGSLEIKDGKLPVFLKSFAPASYVLK